MVSVLKSNKNINQREYVKLLLKTVEHSKSTIFKMVHKIKIITVNNLINFIKLL